MRRMTGDPGFRADSQRSQLTFPDPILLRLLPKWPCSSWPLLLVLISQLPHPLWPAIPTLHPRKTGIRDILLLLELLLISFLDRV